MYTEYERLFDDCLSEFLTKEGLEPSALIDRLSCDSAAPAEADAVLETVVAAADYASFVALMKRRAR